MPRSITPDLNMLHLVLAACCAYSTIATTVGSKIKGIYLVQIYGIRYQSCAYYVTV